jgi:hydroxymethylpyrimidine kinase / phosphomethylpyrimidine kinase / thiamine-phosphate diphosphorylase
MADILPVASEIIRGLYLITDASGARRHEEIVREAIAGGARLIQFRDKYLSKDEFRDMAFRLRKITADAGAAFIVNDDIETALACGADGVHLGQDDTPLQVARKVVGDSLIIGISTHSLAQAEAAQEGGADYIGFGPIFKTDTKDAGEAKGTFQLRVLKGKIKIPVAAIGGINLDNVAEVIEAGADALAIISAVYNAKDAALAARRFVELFKGRS